MVAEIKQSLTKRGRLLHVSHVAARLGISPRTVRYWAKTGDLPGFKLGQRQWRFWEQDIVEYIERRQGVPLSLSIRQDWSSNRE